MKILLVEDDINLREIYAARLSAENYQVEVASDGEEALAKAVQIKPDLILLDVMMPKISGFDVLDILRSTPATKQTKVVMLTALSQSIDRERGEKLGVDKYLVKSQITLEDVVSCVSDILQGPAAKAVVKKNPKQEQAAAIDGALKTLQSSDPTNFSGRTMAKQPPSQMAEEQPQPAQPGSITKPTPGSTNPNNNSEA